MFGDDGWFWLVGLVVIWCVLLPMLVSSWFIKKGE